MNNWSLSELLSGLHDEIERRLEAAREAFGHPVTKGDASETPGWNYYRQYLPRRYQVEKAHVVDSLGRFQRSDRMPSSGI